MCVRVCVLRLVVICDCVSTHVYCTCTDTHSAKQMFILEVKPDESCGKLIILLDNVKVLQLNFLLRILFLNLDYVILFSQKSRTCCT